MEAKVGQDESNSKAAKIIFKEVSPCAAPPRFAQLLRAVPPASPWASREQLLVGSSSPTPGEGCP